MNMDSHRFHLPTTHTEYGENSAMRESDWIRDYSEMYTLVGGKVAFGLHLQSTEDLKCVFMNSWTIFCTVVLQQKNVSHAWLIDIGTIWLTWIHYVAEMIVSVT